MFRAIFLIGCLFFSTAFAQVEQQLAVGDTFACLLAPGSGEATELRCWDSEGKEFPTPRMRGVYRIGGGGPVACAAGSDQVQCWTSPLSARAHGWALTSKLALAGARDLRMLDDNLCGWDGALGFLCPADEHWMKESLIASVHQRLLTSPPRAIASGDNFGCDLSLDSKIACWVDPEMRNKPDALQGYPTDLKNATALAVAEDRGCVLEGDHLQCWGKWDETGAAKLVSSPPLITPSDLGMSKHHGAFVLDEEKVWQLSELGKWQPAPGAYASLEGIAMLHVSGRSFCTVNDQELSCHFKDEHYREPFAEHMRILHGMKILPSNLAFLERLLARVAEHVYPEKRALVNRALEASRTLPPEEKLFVFLALEPLVEGADSDYITKEIRPHYEWLAQSLGKRLSREALRDFPATPELTHATLLVLAACAEGLDTTGRWAELKAKIGLALTAPDRTALQNVVQAADAVRAQVSELGKQARWQGMAIVFQQIVEVLRP